MRGASSSRLSSSLSSSPTAVAAVVVRSVVRAAFGRQVPTSAGLVCQVPMVPPALPLLMLLLPWRKQAVWARGGGGCAAAAARSTGGAAWRTVDARNSRVRCGDGGALRLAARAYTNILFRYPPQHTIPTHSPSGEEIDTDLFMEQLRGLILALKHTQLVEQVHEMRECPYFESMLTADLLMQHYDVLVPMPKFSREHRSAEMSETMRYIRGCGSSADFNHILQDVKGGMASGGDFVSTSHGILMAYGTSRTNRLAMMAMTGSTAASEAAASQQRAMSVEAIEMPSHAPPLGDLIAFAGSRTLIIKDVPEAHHAAAVTAQLIPKIQWQVLKVEPECTFLSHLCGVNTVFDVLCDQDFPESMELMGEAGLNPFPVEWSEPRKLGISMRSVCLVARFARGTMSGGGYANSQGHRSTTFNYNSRNITKNSRLFQGGRRKHGDSGGPLEAQLRSAEIPDPVYQRPPRYAPPMHGRGSLVRNE